jgi:hypothetical protein
MQIEPQNVPASSKAPAGLLPVPDYSANIWTREYLTGDGWDARTYLANKGVQIGVNLNQYVQGVTGSPRRRAGATSQAISRGRALLGHNPAIPGDAWGAILYVN